MTTYTGSSIAAQITLKDTDAVLFDPVSLRIALISPNAQETIFTYGVDTEIVKVSTGIYDFIAPNVADEIGNWTIDCEITFLKYGLPVTKNYQQIIPVVPISATLL